MKSKSICYLFIFFTVFYISTVKAATLRELLNSSNKTSQKKNMNVKFTRDEVITDHYNVVHKIGSGLARYNKYGTEKPDDFLIPKSNSRFLVLHTLKLLKHFNPALYESKKVELRNEILAKQRIREDLRQMELNILDNYEAVATCYWDIKLPIRSSLDEQCWLDEYEYLLKDTEVFNSSTNNNEQD